MGGGPDFLGGGSLRAGIGGSGVERKAYLGLWGSKLKLYSTVLRFTGGKERLGFFDGFKDFWGRQSKNFKVLLTRDLINTLLGRVAGRYGTIYLTLLGAGAVEIGLLNAVSSLVRMVLALPVGLFTDRVKNMKRLYIIARVLSLPVSLIYAAAQSWRIFLVTRVWSAITGRFSAPVMNIISIESLTNRDRVTGLAIRRTIISAVGLVAPLLAAFLITYFGGLDYADSFRPLYIIEFFVGLITFLLLLTQLKEPKINRTMPRTGILTSMTDIFKRVPGLKRFLFMNSLNSFFMGMRRPFMQLYSYEVKKADAFIIAWRGTVSTAIGLMLAVPMSRLADRVGRRKLTYIGRLLGVTATLVTLLTPPTHPEYLIIASFISSVTGTMGIGWTAFTQEYVPLEVRGRWSGISALTRAIIGIPAPIIGGIIWNLNPDYLWWIALFYTPLVSVPLMMSIPDKKREGEED